MLSACLVPRRVETPPKLPGAERASDPLDFPPARDPDSSRGSVPTSKRFDLLELQRAARLSNPNVEEWNALVAAAEARSRQARSLYFPMLSTSGQFLRLEEEIAFRDPVGNSIVVQDRDTYTQTTTLGYEAFDWGKRHHLHQASQQRTIGTAAQRRRALQGLDFRAASFLYSILEAQRDREVAEASVKSLEGALARARELRGVDRATEADVLVVEANLERRRFQVRQLEDLTQRLEDDLQRLLGVRSGPSILLVDPEGLPERILPGDDDDRALDAPVFLETAHPWIEHAFETRPELRALDAAHEALENARTAEMAAYFPSVGLFVQHQYSTTESAFASQDIFSGGVNVAWDLFSGLRRSARIDELEAEARVVAAQHEGLRLEVVNEVRDAVRSLRLAYEAVDVAAKVVEHARENHKRVDALFDGGRATGQELLEAESLLRTEEARANRARYGVYRAIAALRFATGLDYDEELER